MSWIDKRGNNWDKTVYTKEQAEEYSLSLLNCESCFNCQRCIDCLKCERCASCIHCQGCVNCFSCRNQINVIDDKYSEGTHNIENYLQEFSLYR